MGDRFKSRRVDYEIFQGENFKVDYYIVDSAGTPINLTGYTARTMFKDSSGTQLYSATTSDDITIDAIAGKVTLSIPTADTTGFTFSSCFHDIELVDSSNEAEKIGWGVVAVKPEITT